MAPRHDTWESYFYEPPEDRTLRNLFDERDPDVLAGLEYVETAERHRELFAGEVTMAHTFDAAHVAQRSSFTLDYALATPEQWNSASEFSRPDIGQFQVMPDSVVPVFQRIAMNKRASDR